MLTTQPVRALSFPVIFSFPLPSQRRNAFAFCLGVCGFVRPPICGALADDAEDNLLHALRVVNAKGLAFIVSEIVLDEIAL